MSVRYAMCEITMSVCHPMCEITMSVHYAMCEITMSVRHPMCEITMSVRYPMCEITSEDPSRLFASQTKAQAWEQSRCVLSCAAPRQMCTIILIPYTRLSLW